MNLGPGMHHFDEQQIDQLNIKGVLHINTYVVCRTSSLPYETSNLMY